MRLPTTRSDAIRWAFPPAALVVVLAAGCGGSTSNDAAAKADAERRAEKAVAALGGALMKELGAAMTAGGPAAAIAVCSEKAPAVANSLAEPGLSVRRTSLRFRNPANAPDPLEKSILEEWEQAGEAGTVSRVVEGPDGRELRYLKPIRVLPLCVACHGPAEEIAPEVGAELARLYPKDKATGYGEGDLRGAFSVRVKLAK